MRIAVIFRKKSEQLEILLGVHLLRVYS